MEILQVAVRAPLWEYGSQIVMFILGLLGFIKCWIEFLKANNDRLIIKENSNTDRVKHLADAEVEKVKEKSIGADAVVKIWKEFDQVQKEMENLQHFQSEGDTNYQLLKQVAERLQKDIDNVMKAFFDTFKK